jgi:uncharacterized protein (DUF1697 family)
MTTYISILRGINVSGQKLIKMDGLKKMVENLKLENVRTYIQSGNVIFSGNETNEKELEEKIEKQIETAFGFHVPVIVLTAETLKQIIEENPFSKDTVKESGFLHVTFLGDKPKEYHIKSMEDKRQEGEEIQFSHNAVYLYCPNGYGKTKLTNSFIEGKLKVKATTRNWKTANELLAMATK